MKKIKKNDGGLAVEILTFAVAAVSVLFLAGCFGIGWLFGLSCKEGEKMPDEVSDND